MAGLARELGFEQTVPRRLVHRSAVAEVFLTDSRAAGPGRYLVAAQLPPRHGYYGDCPAGVDPLLLLECCRQAGIYGAYRHLGLPDDTTFLVGELSLGLTEPAGPAACARPAALYLLVSVTGGRRTLRYAVHLWLGGRPIGTAGIVVTRMDQPAYEALRRFQRGDAPPRSAAMAGRRWPGAVPPERVGRRDPANVVLASARRSGGELCAELAPRFDNGSLFDHSYDHYPAMVVLEAARQVALLAAGAGARLRAVAGRFSAVLELDRPVLAGTASAGSPVEVAFTQADRVAANVTVHLEAAGLGGAG